MTDMSFNPMILGIDAVSSIKFAGCPSLMYVATKSGQIYEVTLDSTETIVEQIVLILDLSSNVTTAASPSLTASSASLIDQPGLLGMAFAADFETTNLFYVYYSAPSAAAASFNASLYDPTSSICGSESAYVDHVNILAEYKLDNITRVATFSRNLLQLRWPFNGNNGADPIEFAPSSQFLFMGVGDGGGRYDPFGNAQNPDVILGKVQVLDLGNLPANANCDVPVLTMSELSDACPAVASSFITFASGLNDPAGFEFLNPPSLIEGVVNCDPGAYIVGSSGLHASGLNSSQALAMALNRLSPVTIMPDNGLDRYDSIDIIDTIGANYGWGLLEGWSCVDTNLTTCPVANTSNLIMATLPAAVIPENCRNLYSPEALIGGRLYFGSKLEPALRGTYIFGAFSSLQNGDPSQPTGQGALYFINPEAYTGNTVADLSVCPASSSSTGSTNSSAAGYTVITGSGLNVSIIPSSHLTVTPIVINYQFFPATHYFTAIGADSFRTQIYVGVSSTNSVSGGIAGIFRLIPFNEGDQNPVIISATSVVPGQILYSSNITSPSTSPSYTVIGEEYPF